MEALWWGILLAGRILPVVIMVPAFGGRRLPVPASLALTAVVAMAVFPLAQTAAAAPGGLRFGGLLLKELAVGTVLALSADCMFEGLRMGGRLIDDLRGASQASALVPQTGKRTSPLGDIYLLLAVLIFFTAGGPGLFLKALLASLTELPLDVFPAAESLGQIGGLALALSAQAIRVGVSIAAPAAAGLLVADCCLGFINRTAPQIQVFFLGMPLKALIGLAVAGLALEGSLQRFLALLVTR
ncbi:MAG TPA: flagellar biosynthetic protein FliR [Myxococcota bacterium]|nr:flagellar biosynthetic protein FliR [Myxococcota bacterium]